MNAIFGFEDFLEVSCLLLCDLEVQLRPCIVYFNVETIRLLRAITVAGLIAQELKNHFLKCFALLFTCNV